MRTSVATASVALFLAGCSGRETQQAPEPAGSAAPARDERLPWPQADEAFLAAAAATQGFRLGVPEPVAITPDGAVLFRRAQARDPKADLYQLAGAGPPTVLAGAATLLGGAATHGVGDVDVTPSGGRVLVAVGERLFAIDRPGGASREVAIGAGEARDPRLSPDGARVAFVRGGELWTIAIEDPRPVRLTQHPPEHEDGLAEVAARQDLGRARGYWWSPDGQSIAFQRTDTRAVEKLPIGDSRDPARPARTLPFPRPGKAIAAVELGVVPARGGAPRWIAWDRARYPYLARVAWLARAPLTLVVANREQTEVAVLAADPATGKTRPLLVEKDAAWVDLSRDRLTWLDDGSGFLWLSETAGAWTVEHHAADGTHVRRIAEPADAVRRVVGVSADGKDAIVEGGAEPREQHVWRLPLAGGRLVALTLAKDGGVHQALAGHGVIVLRSAQRAGGTTVAVLRPDGSRVELPSVAERPPFVPTTQFVEVKVDLHNQFCAITRPRRYDPTVRYPVLLVVDTDPQGKVVLDARDTYLMDQWYADAGFIVVRTDGRGTADRDRAWGRAVSTDLITIPMNDQIAALKALGARFPQAHTDRTGVLGEGFGGYFAAMAVLLHGDELSAAAAISPILDWELFGAATAERYLRTPAANDEGYRRTSALTYADRLASPLLLIHRPDDERVHHAHTRALLEALTAAGKQASATVMEAGPDPAGALVLDKAPLEHFRKALGAPERPRAMPQPSAEVEEDDDDPCRAPCH
jgi:dipeptidyl-peptidase-4